MRYLSEILAAYQNGDSLTDQELQGLHEGVSQMSDLASKLGPSFHLAMVYASHIQYSTRGMIDARARWAKEKAR